MTIKGFLKKIWVCLLVSAMLVSIMSSLAFALDEYVKVSSLTISVNSTGIKPGQEVEDLGVSDFSIAVTSVTARETPSAITTGRFFIDDLSVKSSTSTVKVGDQLTCSVYLSLMSPEANKYSLKNVSVHVTGATYISSSRSQDEVKITFKTKSIKGQYDSPDEVEWGSTLGLAQWTAPENGSGYYDVTLYRGSSKVYEVDDYSGTSYNFFPWMTKTGEYSFKVRTVAHAEGISSSSRSDWMESGTVDVEKGQTSDGSGQSVGNNGSASGSAPGWFKSGSIWYYRYPNGLLKKNGWEKINGKWYLFDASGAMKTGWQTVDGHTYYLHDSNGDMKTGWIKTTDGKWYYLNPNVGGPQGSMLKNEWLDYNGNKYYLTESGAMAVNWIQIAGRYYYFTPDVNGPEGAMAKNKRIGTFYVGSDGAWIENY